MHTWEYIEKNPSLWHHQYRTLDELKDKVGYAESVLPSALRQSDSMKRLRRENRSVLKMWHVLLSEAFGEEMQPPTITVKFAKEVGHLCRVCSDLPEVIHRLQEEVASRISKGRIEKKFVMTVDVQSVRKKMELEQGKPEPAPPCNKRKRSEDGCDCEDDEGDDVLQMVVALNCGDKSIDEKKVFEEVMANGLDVLCWRHLRIFAGDAVGLLNSRIKNDELKNDELRDRLQKLYDNRDDWVH